MEVDNRLDEFQIELVESGGLPEESGGDTALVIVGFGDVLELRIEVEFGGGSVVADGEGGAVPDLGVAALLEQPDEARVELRREEKSAQRTGKGLQGGGSAGGDSGGVPGGGEEVQSGTVFPGEIFDAEVAQSAFAQFVQREVEGDLRGGAVDPAQKLVDVLGVGAVVLPVDLVGVGVPGVDRSGGAFSDDGVDQHVEHVLTGTELRPVDRPGDAGAADDVGRSSAVDLDVTVDFADEVIHIGHHFDRTGHGEQLGVVRTVFDAVDAGVHVVTFDDAEQERGDVVGLDILELVNLRDHAILRVILDKPEFLHSCFGFVGGRRRGGRAQEQSESDRRCVSEHVCLSPPDS